MSQSTQTKLGKHLIGMAFYIATIVCFSLASIKYSHLKSSSLSNMAQIGLSCLFSALILLPIMFIFYRNELKTARIFLYVLRALIGTLGLVIWVYSVKEFGASQSMLLMYLTPILAATVAAIAGKEKLSWTCIISGIACYLIVLPVFINNTQTSVKGLLFAMLSPLCWSVYNTICKVQTAKEHFLVQVFYTCLFEGLLLMPFYVTNITNVSATEFTQLLVISLLSIGNLMFLFLAIKFATLNWLIPISYLKFPISAVLEFILFGIIAKTISWVIACALIAVNIAMMLLRKFDKTDVKPKGHESNPV